MFNLNLCLHQTTTDCFIQVLATLYKEMLHIVLQSDLQETPRTDSLRSDNSRIQLAWMLPATASPLLELIGLYYNKQI